VTGKGPSPSSGAVERHPHLARPRTPGRVRFDCHLHTMWSGDSTTTPEELAEAIAGAGLDIVCITDHSTVAGALELRDALGCRVVIGQEQRTPSGELIGLFLSERIPPGLRSARQTALAIREQGGVVYVPHPFDPLRHHLEESVLEELAASSLVDAIEVRNGKTSLEHLNEQAARAAARLGLTAGAGSDAHVPEAVGSVYVEADDFSDAPSFLRSLATGQVFGHHFDGARRFQSRIVPSTSRYRR
jgi:predicted metal-dependent phosphoesterase TrpH